MRRGKLISVLTLMVGIAIISVGYLMQQESKPTHYKTIKIQAVDVKNMATSSNVIVRDSEEIQTKENATLVPVEMEVAPSSIVVPPRIEVYEGMTLEEVAWQLEKTLKNDVSGHGLFIATKCIEYGVDPFIATAIIMHETGCAQMQCSNLARNCYNFGGQKGKGCGEYQRYDSIDEGLEGMIRNLYRNYYAYGLTTVEQIGPKYAEGDTWVSKINWYVNKIKYA